MGGRVFGCNIELANAYSNIHLLFSLDARHIALSDPNVKMECVVPPWFFDKLSTPLVTFIHSNIHSSI
jgi:hypothetical protein